MTRANVSAQKMVLVTGGAGFIGSHLVGHLQSRGYRVRILDNFVTGKHANLQGLGAVHVQEGDVRSRDDVARAMVGIHAVFHLAAMASVQWSWTDPVSALAVNAHGTANVVEAALKNEVSVVVYSSSAAVYGDHEERLTSEAMEPRPKSPYGYSKLLGEKIALAHAGPSHSIRTIALRYFNIFGPRQDPDSPYSAVVPIFVKHALNGTVATIYGDGLQSRDFLHVDDAVKANLCALDSGASGLAINIASGQSHTLLQLVDAVAEVSDRTLQTCFAPPREGDIRHSLADISLAATAIGFRPSLNFVQGLRKTLEETRSN